MSGQAQAVKSTILFDAVKAVDYIDLVGDLQRPLANISLEFEQTAVAPDTCAVFINDDMVLRVGIPASSQDLADAEDAALPDHSRFSSDLVDELFDDVQSCLTITVEDGAGGYCSEALKTAACYHVTRYVTDQMAASMVHWGPTDTVYVAEEFDLPTTAKTAPTPRHPVRAAETQTERPTIEGLAEAARKAVFGEGHLAVADMHERLDARMQSAVAANADETRLQDGREEERLRRARNRIFAGDLIERDEPVRREPTQQIGALQQAATYVMTITMLVISFPIGFVMLVHNLVRGEDMMLTARAMALTGVGVGVTQHPQFAQALSYFV